MLSQEIYDSSSYPVGFINSFSNESFPPQKINELIGHVESLEEIVRDLSGTTHDLMPLTIAINKGKSLIEATSSTQGAAAPFAGDPSPTGPFNGTAPAPFPGNQFNGVAPSPAPGAVPPFAGDPSPTGPFNGGAPFPGDQFNGVAPSPTPGTDPQFAGDQFNGVAPSPAPGAVPPFAGDQSPTGPSNNEAPAPIVSTAIESPAQISITEGLSAELTDFQALNYIASHGDLITNIGIDIEAAKNHYTNFGKAEGRTLDDFDEWGYLASNNDLLTNFGGNLTEVVKNYISFGKSEGRSINSFDAQSYLKNNADLRDAFGSNEELATKHYVDYGFNEGRIF